MCDTHSCHYHFRCSSDPCFYLLLSPVYHIPFSISYSMDLLAISFFSLFMSCPGKIFISSLCSLTFILKYIFAQYRILGWQFFLSVLWRLCFTGLSLALFQWKICYLCSSVSNASSLELCLPWGCLSPFTSIIYNNKAVMQYLEFGPSGLHKMLVTGTFFFFFIGYSDLWETFKCLSLCAGDVNPSRMFCQRR